MYLQVYKYKRDFLRIIFCFERGEEALYTLYTRSLSYLFVSEVNRFGWCTSTNTNKTLAEYEMASAYLNAHHRLTGKKIRRKSTVDVDVETPLWMIRRCRIGEVIATMHTQQTIQ